MNKLLAAKFSKFLCADNLRLLAISLFFDFDLNFVQKVKILLYFDIYFIFLGSVVRYLVIISRDRILGADIELLRRLAGGGERFARWRRAHTDALCTMALQNLCTQISTTSS